MSDEDDNYDDPVDDDSDNDSAEVDVEIEDDGDSDNGGDGEGRKSSGGSGADLYPDKVIPNRKKALSGRETVEEFLARGGKVTVIPPDQSAKK